MTPALVVPVLGRKLYPGASVALDFTRNLYRSGTPVVKGSPSLLSGWTFTRASTGYAETAAGALTSFASGAPRITDKGLLVEEARTNLLLRSQEFDNASWLKQSGGVGAVPVITANQALAPDGTMTADLAVFDLNGGTASGDISTIQQTVSSVGNTTQSVYARTSDGTSKVFSFVGPGGTVATVTITGSWTRISVVDPLTGTGSMRLRLRGSASGEGTATSASIYLWGAQLEVGSFPTSYIPTTTASATRLRDVISLSAPAGLTYPLTLFAEIERTVDTGAAEGYIATVFDGSNFAELYTTSGDKASVATTGGGAKNSAASVSVGAASKIAGRCATNDVNVALNGVAASADTTATMPTTPTTIQLGVEVGTGAGSQPCGYIRKAVVYPTAFTDAQLQAATA